MKLSKGIQFFAGSTQTTYDLTNLNLSAGNYAITVVAEAEGFTDSDASNSVNYTVQAQLAAPTIAMNADGKTLEITDVENATSYDVYVDGTLKTNVAKAPSTYTGTISNVGDGAAYDIDDGPEVLIPAGSTVTLTARSDQEVGVWNRSSGDFCPITESTGVNIIYNDQAGNSRFSPIADNFSVTIRPV